MILPTTDDAGLTTSSRLLDSSTPRLPVYRQRGDREIWRIHPYEQTLTRWVRQRDGSYAETVHRGGVVTLAALPGVTIDLDRLFAR